MADAIEVVVVGAGYIGLEVADQFVHRGLKVTVVELQAQVIPLVDREIAEPLNRGSERNGVRLELGRGVAAIEETDGAVTGVTLADGTRLSAGLVQMCIGVRPNGRSCGRRRPDHQGRRRHRDGRLHAHVGSGHLCGRGRCRTDADLSEFQVADVREAAELEELPLCDAPHAKHIRFDQMLGARQIDLGCRGGSRTRSARFSAKSRIRPAAPPRDL